MPRLPRPSRSTRVAAAAAATGAVSLGAAYRFALAYRRRAGLPHPQPVAITPEQLGLPYEDVEIPSAGRLLPGWLIPAAGIRANEGTASARPVVVVVHGWESNRGRALAHVQYLRAAGFHCLVFDVRGHGDNPAETLPVTVGEFGADAAAAAAWLLDRRGVAAVGVIGHSMGGAGALVAAALEPRIGAVVTMSAPADPVRLTRETFRLASLRVPEPVAMPLAWLTARVLLRPRGHSIADASAAAAAARYGGPLLLIHGADDGAVPVDHLYLIARSALSTRDAAGAATVETLVLPEFGHRWLYESVACRRAVGSFFAGALGGPVAPDVAGDLAAARAVSRPPDPVEGFGALGGRATADRGTSGGAGAGGTSGGSGAGVPAGNDSPPRDHSTPGPS